MFFLVRKLRVLCKASFILLIIVNAMMITVITNRKVFITMFWVSWFGIL